MNNRILFFPAIAILVALVSCADDVKRFREGDVVWSCAINGGNATLTSGSADVPAVSGEIPNILIVPQTIRNHRVIALGNFAFAGLAAEEIHLPKTIVNIGGKAFAYNNHLRKVIFPESLRSIDSSRYTYGSFAGCPSLCELVFLGPPPKIANFGTSMDGIVRYTKKYKEIWEKFLYENGVEGGAIYEADTPRGEEASDNQEKESNNSSIPTQGNTSLVAFDEQSKNQDALLSSKKFLLQLDALPLALNTGTESIASVKSAIRDFETTIRTLNERAEKERADLDQKTNELLTKEMGKAQQSGDLKLTLALKKIIDEATYNTPSDIPFVARLQTIRAKRFAEIDRKLRSDGVATARKLYGNVDNAMKVATQDGKFEEAQTLMTFSKEIATWVNALAPSAKQSSNRVQTSDNKYNLPIGRMVSIKANSTFGTEIGSFRQGDIIIVQYVKGTWSNNGPQSFSSDSRPESEYGGMVIYHEDNRIIMKKLGDQPSDRASCQNGVSAVPTDTEHFPFAYKVQKTGRYYLRINDNSVLDDNSGMVFYKIIPIPGLQVNRFTANIDVGKYQWE